MKDWNKVKLGSLLTESKVVSETPDTSKRIRVKLNVQGIEKRPETTDKVGATRYYVRSAGQFIYGKQNLHKGAFGIVPEELEGYESSLDIPAFDIDDSVYPEWIFYYFKKENFYLKLEVLARGVGSKRIHPKQLFDLDIYLPPLEEQQRILDQIKLIERKNEQIKFELSKQEEYINSLRQSILQDTVQGKLTSEWRENNPNTEPAKELLKRISREKEKLISEKKIQKERPLAESPNFVAPYDIPNTWKWCRIDEVVSVVGGITKGKKNRGELFSSPYLRVANVQRGYVDITQVKEILVSEPDYKKYQLELNDLLIIEGGDRDKVGRCALWKNEIAGCIYQNHIFRLRPFSRSEISENYLMSFLNSNSGREYFERNAKQTTNLASINKTVTRNMTIPIPPIKEQLEIVRILSNKNSHLVELQEKIIQSKQHNDDLNQSMLAELLGYENPVIIGTIQNAITEHSPKREITYDNKTTLMELVDLLKQYDKLHAEDLWKMSEYPDDIDAFYAELKEQIEDKRTIKEVENEKGYLELS